MCELHSKFGKEVPCGAEAHCPNHIPVNVGEPDALVAHRTEFLTRLLNMKYLGCRFSIDDLDWGTWNELMVLEQERQWMDSQVDKARRAKDGKSAETPQAQKQVADMRKSLGVPPPGGSLFR